VTKKDKGKGIQKAYDHKIVRHSGTFEDIQISIQNKFNSFSNYSPPPYKTVATGSLTKPQDLYYTKRIENLFLTNLKTPSLPTLGPLIERRFSNFHYLGGNLINT